MNQQQIQNHVILLCLIQSIYHGADVLIKTISVQQNTGNTLVQNFSDTTVLAIKKMLWYKKIH